MKLLLDTHSALWVFAGSSEISQQLQDDITDPANEVYFSHVSAWEIVIKHTLGKLKLPNPPDIFICEMVAKHQLSLREISIQAIYRWGMLPMIHRDPFDRLLVAQAIEDGFSLVSRDTETRKYPVQIHWC